MTTLNATERPRKTLAEQIDRLDGILDGLADNLGEAVADALRQAVRAAVVEALTDPEVVGLLKAAAPAPAVPAVAPRGWLARAGEWADGLWRGLGARWDSAGRRLGEVRRAWAAGLRDRWAWVRRVCAAGWAAVRGVAGVLWQARASLLLALLVALVCGLLSFFAGPAVAAVVSGLGGFGLSLFVVLLGSVWGTVPDPAARPRRGLDPGRGGGDLVPADGRG